jgi:flagellar FliL protein
VLTGKSFIDSALMAISTLVCAGLVAIFYMSTIGFKRPPLDPAAELQAMKNDVKARQQVKGMTLENIVFNLNGRTARLRFLDISLTLLPFKESQLAQLEGRKDQIHDMIINLGGTLTPEDLNTMSGKIIFEERIKKILNDLMGSATIKEVYFSKFVIQ